MEVITTHLHADFDGLASMVAAHKLYPQATMAFPGSQERNLREFFGQSAQVYHFQRLKHIPLAEVTRLIVVDTRQAKRIGNFAHCLENPGLEIHLFDHHPNAPDDLHGVVEEVRPVGSTTTIFVQLFRERRLTVSRDEATLMYLAIHEDTGSFTFDTTTPADLEAAAWLLAQGAESNTVNQYITKELKASEVALLNDLIRSATTYTVQGVEIVVAKLVVAEYIDEFALLVRRFMVMENLDVLFAIANMGERIYLIARSRVPEVNVGKIAMEFGGGGHAAAAAATIREMSMIEAEEKLVRLLHKYVYPRSLARELMSSPVISVPPGLTLWEANRILTKYSITVLPVLRDKKEILGLISRRHTEKAIFHGLGDQPVTDYMTTDFATLPPDATLADIQEIIIEHRQRFIPVVEEGEIKGVITRTDLLNLLVKDPAQMASNHSEPSSQRNRNVNSMIIEYLPREIILLLRTIGEVALQRGWAAYAVGGFVRDLLRRTPNMDLDIVVEGEGIEFAQALATVLHGKVRAHEKFNTAVVVLTNGFKIDVATARLEYYEYPAAMPTVELSSIKLDLFRRDFTINAIALDLTPERFGNVVDFFNCQNDIKDRQIRVLHNLSFVEDPTRIFRAIRFEQRLDFQLGKLTEKLIRNAVKMNLFDRCAGRRFFVELQLILAEENPLPAIQRLAAFQLLQLLNPGLQWTPRLETLFKEAKNSLAWYRLMYLEEPCQSWLVYLLTLFSGLSVQQIFTFCQRFEVPERYTQLLFREKVTCDRVGKIFERRTLVAEVSAATAAGRSSFLTKEPAFDPLGPPLRPSEVYWLLKGISIEGLLYLMGVASEGAGKQAVSLYVTQFRHVKCALHGSDLQKLGYPTGPLYGKILNHLLEAKIDGLLPNREAELAFLADQYPPTATS